MKRLLLLFSIGIVCASPSRAQFVQIGPEIGVNFNKFHTDGYYDDDDYELKPGLKIGGIIDVGFNRMVSFQPGLFYSMKGSQESYVESYAPGITNHVENDIKINYLEAYCRAGSTDAAGDEDVVDAEVVDDEETK